MFTQRSFILLLAFTFCVNSQSATKRWTVTSPFSLSPRGTCLSFLIPSGEPYSVWQKVYQRYQTRFLMAAKAKISSKTELDDFYFEIERHLKNGYDRYKISYNLHHPEVEGPIAYYVVGIVNSTMSFDIKINKPEFEKTGLYGLFLGRALLEFPEVTRISTYMALNRSQNAQDFKDQFNRVVPEEISLIRKAKNIFLDGHVLYMGRREYFEEASQETLDQLYSAVISSMEAVPAIHARRRYGFSNITSILLGEKFGFSVQFGEVNNRPRVFFLGGPQVYRNTTEYAFELTPGLRGTLFEGTLSPDPVLKDFKDYKPVSVFF